MVNANSPWVKEYKRAWSTAEEMLTAGRPADALAPLQDALRTAEHNVGSEHPMVANVLIRRGTVLLSVNRASAAEVDLRRALALVERHGGPDSVPFGFASSRLGLALIALQRPPEALGYLERAVPILERSAQNRVNFLETLSALANTVLKVRFDHGRATALLERVVAEVEALPDVGRAQQAAALAPVYRDLGVAHFAGMQLGEAARVLRRGLALLAEAPPHAGSAAVETALVESLCSVEQLRTDPDAAEAVCNRLFPLASAIERESPFLAARAQQALGDWSRARGDLPGARSFLDGALSLYQQAGAEQSGNVAQTLFSLAELAEDEDNHQEAVMRFEQSRAAHARLVGPEHLIVLLANQRLALLRAKSGSPDEARALLTPAVDRVRSSFGADHPFHAQFLNTLGEIEAQRGDQGRALELGRRALAIHEKALGETAGLLNDLSLVGRAALGVGRHAEALEAMRRAQRIHEKRLTAVLLAGSERQKRLYLDRDDTAASIILSTHLHLAPDEAAARRLAFEVVLARKGRLFDAMAGILSGLRARMAPEDARLLERLVTLQGRLASPAQAPAGTAASASNTGTSVLEAELEALERQLSQRSSEFRNTLGPATLEAIQAQLPEGAVLVEYATYEPMVPSRRGLIESLGQKRYAAFVITRSGEPRSVVLGEVDEIERQVEAFRRALSDPRRDDVVEIGRRLYARILAPVRKLVGDTGMLIVSPEGALNLVPFAALVDESDRFLVESQLVAYVSSARELVRLAALDGVTARSPPLLLAGPAFDAKAGANPVASARRARRSADAEGLRFQSLPGALAEGQALSRLLPEARLLVGKGATETDLRAVHAPRIAHIATHGFFLPDQISSAGARGGSSIENPLLRSGIALAGANGRGDGANDGLLTALEAAGLDLFGTEMVVLSACETGVGALRTGDGVYGLRRSFALAGARTQVMSLWKVDDEATRALMVDFYRHLLAGEPRAEALRRAQMAFLRDPGGKGAATRGAALRREGPPRNSRMGRRHPFFWAAFINAGDFSALKNR